MPDPGTQTADPHYDAIIVGAGAAGGLAARILKDAGWKVLVLDAGWTPPFWRAPYRRSVAWMIGTLANPKAVRFLPQKLVWKGRQILKHLGRLRQPVQVNCFAWERQPAGFVDDRDSPYEQSDDAPFHWLRARQVGGRMVVPGHGRQYYRLSGDELSPGDGLGQSWPITSDEIAPWYEFVEKKLNMTGSRDQLSILPDSHLAVEIKSNASEDELQTMIKSRWPDAPSVLGRYSVPLSQDDLLRGGPQLEYARGAIAKKLLTNAEGEMSGVEWHDQKSNRTRAATADKVFLCASAFESVRLLLLSASEAKPDGIGGSSGVLGRYIMDHVLVRAEGDGGALPDEPVEMDDGRCIYLPRFDQRDAPDPSKKRGFGVQVYRMSGRPGHSYFTAVSFGEMLPNGDNRITLSNSKVDAWGIPVPEIRCVHGAHEIELAQAQKSALRDLADHVGARLSNIDETAAVPGTAAHECGGARMGSDPGSSVLDPYNQCWDTPGLYVTDGAAFPSQGAQNPTLTIMALTARACDHAIRERGGNSILGDDA